jgi:hypothetical protein
MQYLAKNQSTQRCQSLITQGSDHPPILEPHMVLSHCPCLRGPRLALASDLVFGFCLAFDHLFKIFVCFFSFYFFYELVTMCVVNALIKGEIEDWSIRGPVDGRSLV